MGNYRNCLFINKFLTNVLFHTKHVNHFLGLYDSEYNDCHYQGGIHECGYYLQLHALGFGY